MSDDRIAIRLQPDMLKMLKAQAEAERATMSEVVRKAVLAYLVRMS